MGIFVFLLAVSLITFCCHKKDGASKNKKVKVWDPSPTRSEESGCG